MAPGYQGRNSDCSKSATLCLGSHECSKGWEGLYFNCACNPHPHTGRETTLQDWGRDNASLLPRWGCQGKMEIQCLKIEKCVAFLFGLTAWPAGSEFPNQWSNLKPLQEKHNVLTTGLPGKFPKRVLLLGKFPNYIKAETASNHSGLPRSNNQCLASFLLSRTPQHFFWGGSRFL